jgi:Na+/melibiose symporter-like transporter
MMPLGMFASRQFSGANLVTFAVYAALGGALFLLVAFLQISLGYSPLAAGAASLPITILMLLLSARSGALAQRIGARIPLTVGPLVIAVGLLLMTRIDPGDSYVSSVLPAVIVFGLGLTLVVAPVTATVLAAADVQHAGIASGINNAVSRVAGLLAVAVLPLIAGLTGDSFYDPAKMADGFHVAMIACAGLAAAGGILAWLTISSEVLEAEPSPRGDLPSRVSTDFSCAVSGTPLVPARASQQAIGARAAAADSGPEALAEIDS